MGAIIEFLKNNAGTLAVALVLTAVIVLIAVRIVKNKKNGKSTCSCGCSNCPMSASCHGKSEKK